MLTMRNRAPNRGAAGGPSLISEASGPFAINPSALVTPAGFMRILGERSSCSQAGTSGRNAARILCVALVAAPLLAQDRGIDEATLEDLRESYATVARNLATPLDDDKPKPATREDLAIIEARERWRAIALETVDSSDRRIEAVAREGARAQQSLLRFVEQAPDSTDAMNLIGAISSGNVVGITIAALGSMGKHEQEQQQLARLVRSRRAVSFLLAELAPRIAGPSAKDPLISIDFDESWFDAKVPDQLRLRNVSGSRLTRCTVQVDLRGRDGTWIRNIHFVDHWPEGEERTARYATMSASEPQAVLGLSAAFVEELAISFWSDQCRSERLNYPYLGAQRDADLIKQLNDRLRITLDYVARPFTEPGPSLGVTISGIDRLPGCSISLACNGGGAAAPFRFSSTGWEADSRRSFPTRGGLRSCPDTVDVTIRLDGMNVEWRRRLPITSRR